MAKKRQKLPDCLNCKTPLPEDYNFCPKCGQENDQKIKSVYSYLDDSFHDWFAFDNRLWRSIIPFLFRPAYLTKAYCEGKRQDYVTPLRLYLTISVLCFFVVSLLFTNSTSNQENINKKLVELNDDDDKKKSTTKEDTLNKKTKKHNYKKQSDNNTQIFNLTLKIKDFAAAKKILDSKKLTQQQKMDSLKIPNSFWNYMITKQVVKVQNSSFAELINYIINKLPLVMFVLLPFFAWLLHIFYLFSKRKFYYVESLVFTLHTHSFVFFTFLVGTLVLYFVNTNQDDDWIGMMWGWILLINMVYIFAAQKRFYGQGYMMTFIKYSIYSIMYLITLSVGLIFGIIITFLIFY